MIKISFSLILVADASADVNVSLSKNVTESMPELLSRMVVSRVTDGSGTSGGGWESSKNDINWNLLAPRLQKKTIISKDTKRVEMYLVELQEWLEESLVVVGI